MAPDPDFMNTARFPPLPLVQLIVIDVVPTLEKLTVDACVDGSVASV